MLSTFTTATPEALKEVEDEKRVRGTGEVFLLFVLGSQFDHLIKQQLERLGVFCLAADPARVKAADVQALAPIGIILSGGPASVASEPPPFDTEILDLGIPTLGICLGFQLWAQHVGVPVRSAAQREFGRHTLTLTAREEALFHDVPDESVVLESHGDRVEPDTRLTILATTEHAPVAAARTGHLYGVQFHPEVSDTEHGAHLLENFVFRVCSAQDRFQAQDVALQKVQELQAVLGSGKKVLLALSGGSDSATVAYLVREATRGGPARVRGVYIRGIDRPDDEAYAQKYFGSVDWLDFRVVDATALFLEALSGRVAMKDKRVAMRSVYKAVLEKEVADYDADFIAQGTLYTDLSESGHGYASGARKAEIKLHHNTNLGFSVPELAPLSDQVKDGGRNIGRAVGVPEDLLVRHPFPGPGLVVRIEGEVTMERLRVARELDRIYIDELRRAGLYEGVWQAGAVLSNSRATYTKGDDAGMGYVAHLFAVWSVNGFTAQWAELPYPFLRQVSRSITNEVRDIARVSYDISDKPPATIEWG